jgi:hypothetical protein
MPSTLMALVVDAAVVVMFVLLAGPAVMPVSDHDPTSDS